MAISVVIAKPTKDCNADCQYCSTPPDNEGGWTFQQFKTMFDRIKDNLDEKVNWIWHGGEPMLLGPKFYIECYEYAKSIKPNMTFAMQTNLLLYTRKKWKKVFEDIFEGQISTSFDPDEQNRTIKGSTEAYSKQFYKKINMVMEDGFRPLVIGTYTSDTIKFAELMYEKSKARGDMAFSLRFNYRYPAGRSSGEGAAITPNEYGEMLIKLYNKWIDDVPEFMITPLDHMFMNCFDRTQSFCPWTSKCGGKFISIDPNGDVYNCGEFGDLKDPNYRYGNLLEGWIATSDNKQTLGFYRKPKNKERFGNEMLNTYPAKLMSRRRFNLPMSCKSCRHFTECEGGCMRDAELFDRGLGGKFFYCESWKMVFDRIKESILTGEADGVIKKMGDDPKVIKGIVKTLAKGSGYFDLYPHLENIGSD